MGKIKKLVLLAAGALLALALTGCVQLDVEAGIDENHTAYLRYHVQVDTAYFDTRQESAVYTSVKDLMRYYQRDLGFDVEDLSGAQSEHGYDFIMTKQVEAASYAEAFEALQELLSNEKWTVFMEVDMAAETAGRQQGYLLDAQVDMGKILSLSSIESFPPGMQADFWQAVEECSGSVTLVLPASQVESASHEAAQEGNFATLRAPLDFGGETKLALVTRLNERDGEVQAQPMQEAIEQQRLLMVVFLALAGVALAGLLVCLVLLLRRKGRDNHQPPPLPPLPTPPQHAQEGPTP